MLIKLSDLVTDVAPVTLNFNRNIPVDDEVLTVIGYGDTSDGGDISQILLEVDVDTFSDVFCDNTYAIYEPDLMVCAGTEEGGRDSCQVSTES